MAAVEVIFDIGALNALLESPDGEVGAFVTKIAIYIEGTAKALCPVDTGRLRSSITHQIGTSGGSLFARVGSNVDYAPYVELGTRRMSAQPFLTPALYAGLRRV